MSKRKVRIITVPSGSEQLRTIIVDFVKAGQGIVTCLSDSRFRAIAQLIPENLDSLRLFGDVVGESIMRAGGNKLILAHPGHVSAAVQGACMQLGDDSVFWQTAMFPGMHRRIASTLHELRDWGLDADLLDSATTSLDGDTGRKLASLAFIERSVSEALRAIARERGADRIATALCSAADSTDMGRLLVVAGSELTFNQVQWLKWAAVQKTVITVVIEAGSQDVLQMAEKELGFLDAKRERHGVSNRLQANLFGGRENGGAPVREVEVRIESSADPLAECEWVVRSVAEELRSGAEVREICIFCRDKEGYLPLLEASAMRFGVPVSCSRKLPLLSNSFAKLTLDVLEFLAGNDVRLLAKPLRSTYLSLDHETRAAADGAIKSAFLMGEDQWPALGAWAKENETLVSWLWHLLEWRNESLRVFAPLTAWCERLRDFGRHPWHAAALDESSETGMRDSYAQTAMQRSLAQHATIERVQSRRTLSFAEFVKTCRRIWQSGEVSSPSRPDAVQVVSHSALVGPVRSLYLLGLLEGVFPRRRSEDPILTDLDRNKLSELFPDRTPLRNSHDKAASERDEFMRLCGAPSERLVLTYPQTEEERDNVRAFYLVEVERAMAGKALQHDHQRSRLFDTPAVLEADRDLADALTAQRTQTPPEELLTPEAKGVVSAAATRHLTPADLGEIIECPFRYLVNRSLRLEPNRRRSRWHRLYRLPRDTGLASLPFREAAEKALTLALETEVSRHLSDASPHDLALMRSGGERLIDEWLDREFRARELWPRDTLEDKPSFENGHLRSKLKARETFILLKGEFPALSTRGPYRVLHLFAASDPFDDGPDGGTELWHKLGDRQQFELGLYLSALASNTGDPVGIEIDTASGSRLLFLTPRPDEHISSDTKRDFRVIGIDADLRAQIRIDVGSKVGQAVSRIRDALVQPMPEPKKCRFCDYGELCRRSSEYGEEEDPFALD